MEPCQPPGTDLEPVDVFPPVAAPVDALTALQAGLVALDDRRGELVAAGDWESLAWGLDHLRSLKRDLEILLRQVDQDVAKLMPHQRTPVENLGTLERHPVMSSPKWDSRRLLRHLAMTALVDSETGELRAATPMEAAEAVTAIVDLCAPVTASLAWRVTALRELGIDPDDWRDRTKLRDTVSITKA